jgi:coenzyme F420-reducing hydrogenase delta subunit
MKKNYYSKFEKEQTYRNGAKTEEERLELLYKEITALLEEFDKLQVLFKSVKEG